MCCHLAGPPERLALDPKIHQGLRRKNQPGLVCSSTDYKGLGGFFYLPLWYGPNRECQFSPVLLGSPSALIFLFLLTPPLCQTSAFLCFVFPFSSCCRFPCVHLHLTPSVFIPILVTDKKHRIVFFAIVDDISFLEINNFQECNTSYVGINPYSILFLLLGSEITKVNFTIHLLWALTEERDS